MSIMDEAIEKLDQLAELKATKEKYDNDKQSLKDALITPEIKKQMEDIDLEFDEMFKNIDGQINWLTEAITRLVLDIKYTVKGKNLMALYCAGRVSWETKELDRMIEFFPQLEKYCKVGNPYITIRKA